MTNEALQAAKAQQYAKITRVLNTLGEAVLFGFYGRLEVRYENGKVVSLKIEESVKTR